MAQYSTGVVSVTNGSPTVILTGGDAAANIAAGHWFYVIDLTVNDPPIRYTVSANPTLATQFTISPVFAGPTTADVVYAVHRDFSLTGLPIFSGNEAATAELLNELVAAVEAGGGGGGGGGNFQTIVGGFPFAGNANRVAAVNGAASTLIPVDHRFLQNAIAEVAPSTLGSRLFHASALMGTLTSDVEGRVSQWNDTAGTAHATATIGPMLVGDADTASYGLNFRTEADQDILMVATVTANQNTMFFYLIGRIDPTHPASQNILKTAHSAGIDTQTAGDIEITTASSGDVLNLRISTSAGLGQLVALGPVRTGQPFVLAVGLVSGVVSGWIYARGQQPAVISGTYNHGTGFDTNRLRLGKTSQATNFVLHELLLASAVPTDTIQRQVLIWGATRYFPRTLIQHEANPRFTTSPDIAGRVLRGARLPVIDSNGTTIRVYFGPAKTLAVANAVTGQAGWTGSLFRHTGAGTFAFTLPNSMARGWHMRFEQQAGTAGSIALTLASGATNRNSFATSVPPDTAIEIICVDNTNGSSAAYLGLPLGGQSAGGVAGVPEQVQVDLSGGDADYTLLAADTTKWITFVNAGGNGRVILPNNMVRTGNTALYWMVQTDVDTVAGLIEIHIDSGATAVYEGAELPGIAEVELPFPSLYIISLIKNDGGTSAFYQVDRISHAQAAVPTPGVTTVSGTNHRLTSAQRTSQNQTVLIDNANVNATIVVPENAGAGDGWFLDTNSTDTITIVVAESANWQEPVKDKDLAAPPTPISGRYIVGASPTGAWAGRATDIADGTSGAWVFTDSAANMTTWVEDELTKYAFVSGAWGTIAGTGLINGQAYRQLSGTGRAGLIWIRSNPTSLAPSARLEGEVVVTTVAQGDHDAAGFAIQNVLLESELLQNVRLSAGTLAVNLALGNQITLTLTENVTAHTLSNIPATGRRVSLVYRIVQGAS